MRKHLSTILLIVVLLAGLSLLLYPTFSDWWNSFHQSRAIASYTQQVAALSTEDYDRMRAEAEAYNRRLTTRVNPLAAFSDEDRTEYNSILDVTGTGIMGYVEIPSINVSLPIYHGSGEAVLQVAVGHIEGSSFPVGGESTHCVLSGHRGLPSAKLFTDLNQLVEGDIFLVKVLDETLTYEVDQINVVLPQDVSLLSVEQGRDLCTLVTCTPYGINTHRLLVRGHRVATEAEKVIRRVSADATQIEPLVVAPVIAAPMFLVTLVVMLRPRRK